MKHLILMLVLSINIFVCRSQIHSEIICNKKTDVDTFVIKQEIFLLSDSTKNTYNKKDKLLTDSDIENMLVINMINTNIDTLTHEVYFEVNKNKHLLYFISQDQTYELEEKKMTPLFFTKNNHLRVRLQEIASRDVECIYYIPTLFSMTETSEKEDLFYFKLKDSPAEYFFNSERYLFTSLDEVLEYYFGSSENYIETYIQRIKNKEQRLETIRDFYQNHPETKGKRRIRGGK